MRALAFDPEERFATAEDLRDAVLAFLRHRASSSMAREALDRVDALSDVMRGKESSE